VGANDYESTLFGIAPGSALILLEGVTFVEDGTPAEYFKAVYRGDRIKFELESHRTAPARELVMPRVSLRIV
jgi:GntR family transcriptional regulator